MQAAFRNSKQWNNSFLADTNRSQSMKLLAYYLLREDNKIEGARTNLYVLYSWFNLDGNLTLCYCLPAPSSNDH